MRQVFEEYMSHVMRYSNLVEKLPTRAFLVPLAEDEEVEIELAAVGGIAGILTGSCWHLALLETQPPSLVFGLDSGRRPPPCPLNPAAL
jgi:hypothetical protein